MMLRVRVKSLHVSCCGLLVLSRKLVSPTIVVPLLLAKTADVSSSPAVIGAVTPLMTSAETLCVSNMPEAIVVTIVANVVDGSR